MFRFQGLRWDEGHHLHPDERFISMVEEKLTAPRSVAEYFDSSRSSLNPYNHNEGSFVYGSLPMVLAKGLAALLHKKGYDGTYLVGRALSGLFDLVTVWLVYLLARRLMHRRGALFAASLMAFCVLGIQLSHFWTVDTFLTTFTVAALLGAVRIAQGRSAAWSDAATGVAVGLAIACKITALALLGPVGLALLVATYRSGSRFVPATAKAAARLLIVVLPAAAVVRIALPNAFLGSSAFSLRLDPRWINDLKTLSAIQHSVAGFPPAFQWAGRTVLFPLENIVLWGAGVFFGLAGLAAVAWSVAAIVRRRELALIPVTSHVLFLLGYHGLTLVKSIRYFYPAYPGLAVLAAAMFSAWIPRSHFPRLVRAAAVAVLGGTFLWAVAFTSIYRHTQTRVAASRWIFAHVPAGQRFANESWDDPLPMGEEAHDPSPYAGPSLPLVDPDSAKKAEDVVQALRGADWIAVTSGRTYMNVTRVPAVFPMSIAYYRALFDGSLGFDRMADISSYPGLGPLRFPDDRSEEQFTVYDHPRVLLFRKSPRFSADKARALLLAAIPTTPPTMNEWERWSRALRRVVEPVRPDRRAFAEEPPPALEGGLSHSLSAAILWYLALGVVGLAGAPLCWAAFPRLRDRGLGFARLAGLVAATYLMTAALTLHLLPNGRRTAVLCLLVVAAAAAVVFLRDRHDFRRFLRENRRDLLISEAVFAAGFLLFLGIRALNPEIYWGEKPMDFSILNILVRTPSLPASDPWLAGAPLGYYTFGHEMVVLLTFLTHLSTRYTFNLAFGMLGGTILQGAFALARNWGGTLRAGIAGGALTLLLGNLAGLREWLVHKRHLDWDYFWATSRVIRDTINEYPLWSLTFADLHAHVFAIPIFLLFAAAALHLVRLHAEPVASPARRIAGACLLGFLAATQALTNAWDVPLLAGLLVLVPVTAALAVPRPFPRGLLRGLLALAIAAASAYAFARPLWVRIGHGPAIGKNVEASASGPDQLTVFGLFFVLALGWWLSAASDRLESRGRGRGARIGLVTLAAAALAALAVLRPDAFLAASVVLFLAAYATLAQLPEERLAAAYLGTAFFLVLFCQRLYIYDRMNTFFKLYLEAWLLFASATAALVFGSRERRGTIDHWAWPARAGLGVLAAAALFTSVTGVRAAVSRHFAPYDGPSLDGLRYLETLHPGEYKAVMWMRRTLQGTPVMLEAQGPSYQDFGRISMLTGLPTVLGWDYHVKQRGNSESEIEARKRAVETIYSTTDARQAETLLKRYRVGFVYVGWLERRTYSAAGLRKFKTNPQSFELAYENPEVSIFRCVGGPTQDVLLPTKEELPESKPAPAQPEDEPEEKPAILDRASGAEPPFSGLREPRGMAVDDRGRLWVADFGHSRLRVFDGDGGALGGWGGRGSGRFGFRELCGVAIRGDTLAVADTWNGRVLTFSTAGVPRAVATELYGPRGVSIAPDGRVWATDTGNHRVVVYDSELGDARFIGKKGTGWDDFSSPVGIAAAPSGAVYVADSVNRRIQILNRDGTFRGHFALPGWGENVEPQLAVDDDDTIYATNPSGNDVFALDATGRVVHHWEVDDAGRKFQNPTGIGLDRKHRILYVVNAGNSSVVKLPLPDRRTP